MIARIEARVRAFFSRPAVQSVVRHVVVTAGSAAIAFVAVHGVAGVATAAGAALLIRAVWVAVRPVIAAEVVPPVEQAVEHEVQEVVSEKDGTTTVEIKGA